MSHFNRRNFLEIIGAGAAASSMHENAVGMGPNEYTFTQDAADRAAGRGYNGPYSGPFLSRVAFPIGGIGAGMYCLEGTGAISHVSIRNTMEIFNEPRLFAAVCVKGSQNIARVLEGPVQDHKIFGSPNTGRGSAGSTYGLPRFAQASFLARFPFGQVSLRDPDLDVEVGITGWSPFIPGDADNSSLPVGALEYEFKNVSRRRIDAVFSFNNLNWRRDPRDQRIRIRPVPGGFRRHWDPTEENPWDSGDFAFFVDGEEVSVDHYWFSGGWWDSLTIAWKNIQEGNPIENPAKDVPCPGASLSVPFSLDLGEVRTVRLMTCWYVPKTNLRIGGDPFVTPNVASGGLVAHSPWYAGRFKSISDVASYWVKNYGNLKEQSEQFRDALYDTTIPAEALEAVAANLTILKSPTVLRQVDGRLWCWEGCNDTSGCCAGSCTHVWNYAQAIPHLFPGLERSLRHTEFNESQNAEGHQCFRSYLPIREVDPAGHERHAAADGQLGGIMKVYREWRISGDTQWLRQLWPEVKKSMAYCIDTWDPRHKGIVEEPHHNTYDIEFWGPDGMITGFYLGALTAAAEMSQAVGDDSSLYSQLLENGKGYLNAELFDGEYYFQKIQWEGLEAKYEPLDYSANGPGYENVLQTLNSEGPKYQYGTGCLSDVVLGFWMAQMCGLGEITERDKVVSSLRSIHKYNLRRGLSKHVNPQRPSYALGKEGGLILCSWPKGGELSLPFVYSNEVWTGIEYQVASHLILEGLVDEGLEIVRICRDRYSGAVRNPFNEYECGHWYARAMSSYGLIQALTGVRYDAVTKTLYVDSRIGDFRSFLATESGFGTVELKGDKATLYTRSGRFEVERCLVSGKEVDLMRS